MKVVSTNFAPPTATTPAPPAEPKVVLEFKIDQDFKAELSNQSSPEFKALSNKVASAVSPLSCFMLVTVIQFNDKIQYLTGNNVSPINDIG